MRCVLSRAFSRLVAVLGIIWVTTPVWAQSDVTGSGTGFFVNPDGWLVTNAHVVGDCGSASIPGYGTVSDIKLDVENDLAVARVDTKTPATPLVLRSKAARLGEDIVAFGYPLASILSSSVKVTTGNVNSLLGMNDDTRFLQISSPIQPGNSGGPVVDKTGLVLGITTSTLKSGATGDANVTPQNVNFAIRSSVLQSFLESRGIAFSMSEDPSGPQPNTADLSERVVASVVQLLCHGKQVDPVAGPVETTTAPIPKPYMPQRGFETVDNADVVGFDFATLSDVSMSQCQAACQDNASCKALTYNKRQRFCFLKNDAKIAVRNPDATTSVVEWLSASVKVSTFVIASDRDMRGGDYRTFKAGFIECYLACEIDMQCKAFSYIRKKRSCWMKNGIGAVTSKAGVDLGIR